MNLLDDKWMDRWVISRMLVTTALKCCFKVELYYLLWGLNEAMQGKCPRDLLLPLGLSVSFRGRLGLRGCSQRPVVSERVRWEPCTAQDCWPSVVLCLSPVCENLSRGHKEYTPRCFDLKKKRKERRKRKHCFGGLDTLVWSKNLIQNFEHWVRREISTI